MTRFFKLLGALALLAAGSAQAQSSVQMYGLVDMSGGVFQDPGNPRIWKAESGSMSTSFIGIKGIEDLGGGVRARFAINHFMRLDTGSAGRFNGDAFWARDAYVGLSGAFGTTTLGRNTTPLFVSTVLFNAFGDSYGFSPAMRQLFTPRLLPFFGDTGWNNSVAYASNDDNGFTFNLLANLGENDPASKGKNLSFNLLYFTGPLGATVAWQRVKNGAVGVPPGWDRQDTLQLGATYALAAVKLYGQYSNVRTSAATSSKTALYSIGASIGLMGGKLLAQYGHASASIAATDTTNKTLTLGYDYALSKNTDVYAVYMHDRVTGLTRANSAAAGMRVRF